MDTDMINEAIMRDEIITLVTEQFELTEKQAQTFIDENMDVITDELWEVFLNSVEYYVNDYKSENNL
jgi:hypothetical protein